MEIPQETSFSGWFWVDAMACLLSSSLAVASACNCLAFIAPRSNSSGPSKQNIRVEAPNCNISPGKSMTPRAPD